MECNHEVICDTVGRDDILESFPITSVSLLFLNFFSFFSFVSDLPRRMIQMERERKKKKKLRPGGVYI